MTAPQPGQQPGRPSAESDAATLAAAEAAFQRVTQGTAPADELLPDLEPADLVRWAGDRVTELLADFAELPLDRLVGLTASVGRAPADPSATAEDPTSPETADAGLGEPVVLRATAGTRAEARIWVHLVGDPPPANLGFALSGLLSDQGVSLPGESAAFEPAALFVPAPAGATTLLRYPVPDGTPPGRYQGLVVGRGVAGAVVAVTLVVS